MSRISYVDVLGKNYQYIIFRKNNKIQVIFNPTAKQIRQRGKNKWQIFKASESNANIRDSIDDLKTAILVMGK